MSDAMGWVVLAGGAAALGVVLTLVHRWLRSGAMPGRPGFDRKDLRNPDAGGWDGGD